MHQEDQISKFICGKATFKNILKKNMEIIQKSEEIQNMLKNNEWIFQGGNYQKYNWKEIFLHMSECLAEQLILEKNNRVQIISQIQYVQYSNLKILFLWNNKINNIQSLSSIHFNYLQWLGLDHNEITQIKSLNKLSTLSLNCIDLDFNPLIEINALTRSKINSKLLKSLSLQFFDTKDPINQDLSVIVKLSCELVESLWVYSNKRINQIKVSSMLKLKSPSIYIKK